MERILRDRIEPGVRVLFVGINPGLWTAAVQAHFARRGNRFYPALFRAGIVGRVIDASAGYTAADRAHLLERGLGVTNLAPRPTARADEVTAEELIAGVDRLARLVAHVQPAVVAVLGITAYRTAFQQPKGKAGKQLLDMGPSEVWVLPNPSGLNAHASLDTLAAAFREVAKVAGVLP